MDLDFTKGPRWSISQRVAALIGLFAGGGVSDVLLYYHLIPRNWAMVVIVAAIPVPPAIMGWWKAQKGLSEFDRSGPDFGQRMRKPNIQPACNSCASMSEWSLRRA